MPENNWNSKLSIRGDVYKQSTLSSRIILMVLIASIIGCIAWAAVAEIDVSIPATGKFEPKGEVNDIQAVVDGEVSGLRVEDGQRVSKGESLLDLVPMMSVNEESKLKSYKIALENVRQQYATESRLLEKLRSIVKSGAVSQFEVEQKKLDVLKLKAQCDDFSEQINKQEYMAGQASGFEKVTSPVSGTVFDVQVRQGSVVKQGEAMMKVVPEDYLIVKAFIPNQDIGFIYKGLPADVRIDAFPYAEFGDIKGSVEWVGSDVLAPTQIIPYYHFPIKVKLARQYLTTNGKKIFMQSGMSVSVNIKIRKRTVMSIFTDLFTRQTDAVSHIRN